MRIESFLSECDELCVTHTDRVSANLARHDVLTNLGPERDRYAFDAGTP